jgi:hypothetical protein
LDVSRTHCKITFDLITGKVRAEFVKASDSVLLLIHYNTIKTLQSISCWSIPPVRRSSRSFPKPVSRSTRPFYPQAPNIPCKTGMSSPSPSGGSNSNTPKNLGKEAGWKRLGCLIPRRLPGVMEDKQISGKKIKFLGPRSDLV